MNWTNSGKYSSKKRQVCEVGVLFILWATVFIPLSAAAQVKFSVILVRRLFEGDIQSNNYGPRGCGNRVRTIHCLSSCHQLLLPLWSKTSVLNMAAWSTRKPGLGQDRSLCLVKSRTEITPIKRVKTDPQWQTGWKWIIKEKEKSVNAEGSQQGARINLKMQLTF